jgi:hypothetical protein
MLTGKMEAAHVRNQSGVYHYFLPAVDRDLAPLS